MYRWHPLRGFQWAVECRWGLCVHGQRHLLSMSEWPTHGGNECITLPTSLFYLWPRGPEPLPLPISHCCPSRPTGQFLHASSLHPIPTVYSSSKNAPFPLALVLMLCCWFFLFFLFFLYQALRPGFYPLWEAVCGGSLEGLGYDLCLWVVSEEKGFVWACATVDAGINQQIML